MLAKTSGLLFLGGGAASAVSAAADPVGSAWLFLTSGSALVGGAVVLLRGHRTPHAVFQGLCVVAGLLVSAAVVLAPDTATALVNALLYTLVATVLFSYFPPRVAAVHLLLVLALAGAAAAVRGLPAATAAALVIALAVSSLAVRSLSLRAGAARRDELTGLLNHLGFERDLDEAVAEADRTGTPLTVALVDVDRFRDVNRSGGRPGGDALLRVVASDLVDALPDGAVVARLSGDEFAVALPGADDETAARAVEAARSGARHSLSAGTATRLPQEPTGEWLRRADAALAEAKQLGRGRMVRADVDSAHLASGLAAALTDRRTSGLRVALQPVVEVGTGRVFGVEALARWDHPSRGPVSPAQFVPVAERAGLVPALGAFVLRRACRDVRGLRDLVAPDLVLTVNASGHELVDDGYADHVLQVLATTGLPPEALVVEVTESVVEGSSAAALLTVDRLRRHGVRIAIDDFGAGYSTYSRLDTLPADVLKLDGALLEGATTSARRRALLESAVGVGHALGLEVLVEGVETPEQAALLSELGCTLAQGYHYSRPVPAAELLERWTRAAAQQDAHTAEALPAAFPAAFPAARG